MVDSGGTWLVLLRDVSGTVRVRGVPRTAAALVLDVATGLARGVAVGASEKEALDQTFAMALNKAAGPLPPAAPDAVLCAPALAGPVGSALRGALAAGPVPPVTEVLPGPDAEDIFDSLVGGLAGRSQPAELPEPEDWRLLFDHAQRYWRQEPWARWSDEIDLELEVTISTATARTVAVVMGNAGVEHGLVLYPGDARPDHPAGWQSGEPMPTPPGTLVFTLGRSDELPDEVVGKALRYGWPDDAELFPALLALGPDEGADLGRQESLILIGAIAAVLAHDARGPILARGGSEWTTGTVPLPGGRQASFTIRQQPRREDRSAARLAVHQVGDDLVPEGTPVVLGHMLWDSLPAIREGARLYRPARARALEPAGAEVPLVAILPRRSGDRLAGQLAALDPLEVAVVESDDGNAHVVAAGANGAEMLMVLAADSPALATFRRRLRRTKGRHLLMVADETTARGKGTVYALFECQSDVAAPRGGRPPPPLKRRR